ncbi:transposase DDE domain protein [Vibrio cholerae HE-40]|uniref:IS5 family transposase n=1 Tax=Vibrio cholerae TaxID=666 RepID=UPI000218F78F|nr:IS5 family transposase [Vibrio cholerae]EGR03940.1 transposase DDE domain protein [Vibrio cholerae HE39]EKL33401.1 transposase DDE domain protein [Vibrio cholerae HE-40]EKL37289.1 transposase DDE domain protein [Vibrio cholerae HE-46]ORP20906.1 IS5/IS1182 family transposase [Vibrio cholerae]
MPRTMLTDKAWETLKQILKETGRVYNKYEHRDTLEGILYRMRTGIQWRDLPEKFGRWNSVFRRFNLWSKKGVLRELFQRISSDNDPEWLFIDGSIVKAHQDSSGAASRSDEAIGKSRGGSSTKIHLAVDSGGLPVYFEISGGQVNDIIHAQSLISEAPKSYNVTADKGYDSNQLRTFIKTNGGVANIPRRENSKIGNVHMDWCLYKYRHLVENAFLKIKRFRGIATRYDKLARNYASNVALAFVMMWLPMHC